MSTMVSDKSDSERRRFFRIRDEIILFFSLCDEEDTLNAGGLKQEVVGGFSLSTALNHLTEEARMHMKIVEKDNPDIAACLKVLGKKIDLISHTVLMSDLAVSSQSAQEVDLSASGLAFVSELAMETGTVLELKMILPPALIATVVYGRVVHCKKRGDSSELEFGFKVGVEFIGLSETDRELLIRHIVKKQMKQLRNRNESA